MKKSPISRVQRGLHKEMMGNSLSVARGATQYSQAPFAGAPINNMNRGPKTGNARRPRRPS